MQQHCADCVTCPLRRSCAWPAPAAVQVASVITHVLPRWTLPRSVLSWIAAHRTAPRRVPLAPARVAGPVTLIKPVCSCRVRGLRCTESYCRSWSVAFLVATPCRLRARFDPDKGFLSCRSSLRPCSMDCCDRGRSRGLCASCRSPGRVAMWLPMIQGPTSRAPNA